jgi:hypothetical protein
MQSYSKICKNPVCIALQGGIRRFAEAKTGVTWFKKSLQRVPYAEHLFETAGSKKRQNQ